MTSYEYKNIIIIKTEVRLGIKPIKIIKGEIFFLRFQLTAPVKTKIIIEQKMQKLLTILYSRDLKKNLSNKIIKNGKSPK